MDEKIKKLTLELRCMTCQNQSVYDSDAEFSEDIKNIVRDKFNEGKSEYEIKRFLVERYGEYILFRPLVNFNNLFLWAFPFILLTIGVFFLIFQTRKK
ncbi:cytochrome c-type biogenesis protein CcmH [Pelagibacteraceae bacterium]|nr:cytochrome c-type biogenesis protein CcmH [Pelagibacteraceae bacterium]